MNDSNEDFDQFDPGDPFASATLFVLVYEELRRIAAGHLKNESAGQTLQPTALVHEAYLRLVGDDQEKSWDGKAHFFAAAAEAMRRILIENARRKKAVKHGGGRQRVELGEVASVSASDDDLIAMDEALTELEKVDEETAKVVKLHYFAGLSYEQVGKALNISERTANRRWDYAKAWLRRRMKAGPAGS